MLVFRDPGNIPSLLLAHTISTCMTNICEIQFLHTKFNTSKNLCHIGLCVTPHETQFFKESLEIKFKAFYRHASSKATFVLQKSELISIVSTLIIFIIYSCYQVFQYFAKMILTKTSNIFKKKL